MKKVFLAAIVALGLRAGEAYAFDTLVVPSCATVNKGWSTNDLGRPVLLDPSGRLCMYDGYGVNATPLASSSGNVANATATATLAGAANVTTYLSGFIITYAGATAASVVVCTVTGVVNGPLHYEVAVPAGATVGGLPVQDDFYPPLPASATNTSIVVSCPAMGAGNTNAAVVARGYRQ